MGDIVIKVENLSKEYRLGTINHGTLKHDLQSWWARIRGKEDPNSIISFSRQSTANSSGLQDARNPHFLALKDVSFEVKRGEILGIIGKNGAGKSTLLKVLSQVTSPTKGVVKIKGRIASLLEVGTGFHPELTGRENIFLNGAILGMTKKEISRKFEEIVDFAEVEKFVETPVKRYSSGMYVRLAFAVAAHLDPEILIVDEVLAVGDAQFQKKCLGKMEEVGKGGRTILFVSHNMSAIKNLCDSGVLLNSGMLLEKGAIQDVVNSYSASLNNTDMLFPLNAEDIIIHKFNIKQNNVKTDHIDGSTEFQIQLSFDVLRNLSLFRIGIYIKTYNGETVLRSFVADWDSEKENIRQGKYEAFLTVPDKFLAPGNYLVILHASRYGLRSYLSKFNCHQKISISAPLNFNEAHKSEVLDSCVLSKNLWEIKARSS